MRSINPRFTYLLEFATHPHTQAAVFLCSPIAL